MNETTEVIVINKVMTCSACGKTLDVSAVDYLGLNVLRRVWECPDCYAQSDLPFLRVEKGDPTKWPE
jgi:hypothetical protein